MTLEKKQKHKLGLTECPPQIRHLYMQERGDNEGKKQGLGSIGIKTIGRESVLKQHGDQREGWMWSTGKYEV